MIEIDSKALLEHSVAVLHQRLGHTDMAKEALGRALQEDLAYYPAHVQLGYIALDHKDTTTALSELDLAIQLQGGDESVRDALDLEGCNRQPSRRGPGAQEPDPRDAEQALAEVGGHGVVMGSDGLPPDATELVDGGVQRNGAEHVR